MFRWRQDGLPAGSDVEKGAEPSAGQRQDLYKDIQEKRDEAAAKEAEINSTLRSVYLQKVYSDSHTYAEADIHPQLRALRETSKASNARIIEISPHFEEVLSSTRSAGHDAAGTKAQAESLISDLYTKISKGQSYNADMTRHIQKLNAFRYELTSEITRQTDFTSEAQKIAALQNHSALTKPDMSILRAKSMPPTEFVNSSFFTDVSRAKNDIVFDIALKRMTDVNAQNIKGLRPITFVSKEMYEHGIKELLARDAITQDTLLYLLDNGLDKEVKLLIKLVGPHGYHEIFTGLETSNITHISFSEMGLKPEGLSEFARALEANNSVLYVDISENELGGDGAYAFGELFKKNSVIKEVKMESADIHSGGVCCIQPIADGLAENSSLEKIDFARNQIPYYGGIAIARSLHINKSLQILDLSDNQIGDEGTAYILQDIISNLVLVEINLSRNKITDKIIKPIKDWIINNYSIIKANFEGNDIADEKWAEVASALEENHTLLELKTGSDASCSAITQNLSSNKDILAKKIAMINSSALEQSPKIIQELFAIYKQITNGFYNLEAEDLKQDDLLSKMHEFLIENRGAYEEDIYSSELLAKTAIFEEDY